MNTDYQIPVLLYHRVIDRTGITGKHKLHVWKNRFVEQMRWLKANGYETITFRDLADNKCSPQKKQIILTFDDGYDDNYYILFPILKELGFTAVIYLVTACRQNEWSRSEGEPALNLMGVDEIKEMDAYGIEFGGHTQTHADLKNADTDRQQKEISGCYNDLVKLLDKHPVSFSYPYGAYNDNAIGQVKNAGFKYAVTTVFGPETFNQHPYTIRRLEVRPHSGLYNFKRKASGRYFRTSFLSFPFSK